MFWKVIENGRYAYHAILSISVNTVLDQSALYGQMHVRLELANGNTEEHTFENSDWRKFQESYLKGGFVLNP